MDFYWQARVDGLRRVEADPLYLREHVMERENK